MSTRNCPGMDSMIKPLDTIPEDKKVRVQRTQSTFDPFEKPANQVKRVHSENNACINFKTSSAGKESPKVRRHSSPSSVSALFSLPSGWTEVCPSCDSGTLCRKTAGGFISAFSCMFSLGVECFWKRARVLAHACANCWQTLHQHPATQWEMIQLTYGKIIFFLVVSI